jgi:hypothetical protein
MNRRYPSGEEAEKELSIAEQRNPGPWVRHSLNTGLAAKYIAQRCEGMNAEKAYVLGALHDIGRRVGIVSQKHILEGYHYCMSKGWKDAARICMTHSFMIQDIEADVGVWDVSADDYAFMKNYIETIEYDDYDRLFQLCDSLALANGFCLLEKRFVDVHRRYGTDEYTVPRWNAVFQIKEYFEEKMGCSIYDVLPNVKETTFIDTPLWKPPNR